MGYSPEVAEEPKARLRLWVSFPPAILKRGTQPQSGRLYFNTQDGWCLHPPSPSPVVGAEAWHFHGRLGHRFVPALSQPPRDGQSAVPPPSIQLPQGTSVRGAGRQKSHHRVVGSTELWLQDFTEGGDICSPGVSGCRGLSCPAGLYFFWMHQMENIIP